MRNAGLALEPHALGSDSGTCEVGRGQMSRKGILHSLQERAFKTGGNAVIYAVSQVTSDEGSDCNHWEEWVKSNGGSLADVRPWGHGWIVQVTE